ncbi:MAG: DUF2490 domain-containing protein [Acidobacteria bacterium]|nr:DUF2490 domain-containing protein [Acidobacteriota bacterium]MDA1237227.1 DUF2490 domain-containing protein [Acidobacteriota bacterium]
MSSQNLRSAAATPIRILIGRPHAAVAVLLCLMGTALQAQEPDRVSDPNFHAWYMYFGDHSIGESPWGLHFDGQWRRQGVGQQWQQLLLRPGINYDLNSHVQVSGGYAFIQSHPYGSFPAQTNTPEHRIWQQLILRQKVGKANLAHRFRLEQRHVGITDASLPEEDRVTGYSYRNRVRYFAKGTIPIGHKGPDSDYFLAAYNEIMFNFGRNTARNIFDQNRAYIAIGRKLPGVGALEIGYLQQTVQQGNGRVIEFNHTLQIGLFSTRRLGR